MSRSLLKQILAVGGVITALQVVALLQVSLPFAAGDRDRLAIALTPRAQAFPSATTFQKPAAEGGGGGRFFTGAPHDGFSCDVCHQSETSFPLKVEGLPHNIIAGQEYRITLHFGRVDDSFSYVFAGEIYQSDGRSAGTVIPDPSMGLSVFTRPETPEREVFFFSKQPTKRTLHLTWTPHTSVVQPLWIAISGVASDGSSDFSGDQVTWIHQSLAPAK